MSATGCWKTSGLLTVDSVDDVAVSAGGDSLTFATRSLASSAELRFLDDITRGSAALVLSNRPSTPSGPALSMRPWVSLTDAVALPDLSRGISPNRFAKWIRIRTNALSDPAF